MKIIKRDKSKDKINRQLHKELMGKELVDFQSDVIEDSWTRPVVVDFWAAWCGPCRILGPTLEKLAEEAGDAWTLVKVNTDLQPELAGQFNIRGIPAVKLFISGEVVSEFVGALSEDEVQSWLNEHLPEPILVE